MTNNDSNPPAGLGRSRQADNQAWRSSNNAWKKAMTGDHPAARPPEDRTRRSQAIELTELDASADPNNPNRQVQFQEASGLDFFDDFSPDPGAPAAARSSQPDEDFAIDLDEIGEDLPMDLSDPLGIEMTHYPTLDLEADARQSRQREARRKEKEAKDAERRALEVKVNARQAREQQVAPRRPPSGEQARREDHGRERREEARRERPADPPERQQRAPTGEQRDERRDRPERRRSGDEAAAQQGEGVPLRVVAALQKKIEEMERQIARLSAAVAPDASAEEESRPLLPAQWGRAAVDAQEIVGGRNRVDFFLRLMIDKGASDFHLHVGNSPLYRQGGNMSPMRYRPMRQLDWERLMRPITPGPLWEAFERTGDVDFAYEIPGLARFRVNMMQQHRGGGAVFRLIPSNIMTLEQLGIPPQVSQLAGLDSGLVLITGPTGSGKSTTLAALIDLINRRKADHLITIEDPIEFVHPRRRCLVHQREVGTHTSEFNEALKAAIREDPDLILVGEMRDRETMLLALQAAEKGMLVYGTLHTNSAAKTVDRIINAFPVEEQDQVRGVLAGTLRGVVSQQLLRRVGGGRVAALEILFSSRAMANLIREGKTHHIPSLMQTGRKVGMIQMDESLMTLIKRGIITREAALEKAIDKEPFKDTRLDRFVDHPEQEP